MRQEYYKIDEFGNTVLDYVTDDGILDISGYPTSGTAVLVNTTGGARVTVTTPHAGKFIVLQREQASTANMGNIAITNVVDGVSFQIRSTVAADTGTINWAVIED